MISKRKKISREHRPYERFILPVVVGILFVGIIAFLAISDWRINKKRADMQSQIQSLEEQLKALEEQKAQLESGIQQGQSETFLEEQAREKLGLKKPGEEVVSVLPPAQTSQENPQENKSLWQKILEALHLRQ